MGLFANTSTPLDPHIERATSDKNTSDDWAVILDVCDRVKEYNNGPKDCIKSLNKKLISDNPRVALQAITLLDACINNCGRNFLLEVASREFEQELLKIITSLRTHAKVAEKFRKCLKSWAEGEFKNDRQLSLIPALYTKLQQDGYDFSSSSESPKKKKQEYSTDPNVVNNKAEEDDIAMAIQLSLQSASNTASPKGNARSLYPSDLGSDLASNLDQSLVLNDSKGPAISGSTSTAQDNTKKARALYDFEAVEDNELTFQAGELIVVIDGSDPNWWKGSNHRGEGLFPANFVTLDIHGENYHQPTTRNEKRVSFSEMVKVTELEGGGVEGVGLPQESVVAVEVTGEVDESKVDFLLHLLHEADPTGNRPDDPQLPGIEEQVAAMAPTIDAELEQIDRRHNELSKLNVELMQGINLYHQLMREMPVNSLGGYYPAVYGGQQPPPSIDPVTGQIIPPPPPQHMMPGYSPYPGMPMMGAGAPSMGHYPPPMIGVAGMPPQHPIVSGAAPNTMPPPPPPSNSMAPGSMPPPACMPSSAAGAPATTTATSPAGGPPPPHPAATGPIPPPMVMNGKTTMVSTPPPAVQQQQPQPPPPPPMFQQSAPPTTLQSQDNAVSESSKQQQESVGNGGGMLQSYGHFPDAGQPPPGGQYNTLPPNPQQQQYPTIMMPPQQQQQHQTPMYNTIQHQPTAYQQPLL